MDKNTKSPHLVDLDDREVETEIPTCPAAEALAARIAEQRKQLAAEEANERSLTVERKRLLTQGTDAQTDACEASIDASRSIQVRILERIDLLAAQLKEANEAQRKSDLDAIAARANAAREEGERLIRTEYPKLAKPLGALLRKLKALDAVIDDANYTLEAAGRKSLTKPNDMRCTMPRRITWTERVTVGPADHRHPEHQHAYSPGGTGPLSSRLTKQVIQPLDITVECTDIVGGDYQEPLYEAIKLPRVEPLPYIHKSLPPAPIPPIYFDPNEAVGAEEVDALRKKLTERIDA